MAGWLRAFPVRLLLWGPTNNAMPYSSTSARTMEFLLWNVFTSSPVAARVAAPSHRRERPCKGNAGSIASDSHGPRPDARLPTHERARSPPSSAHPFSLPSLHFFSRPLLSASISYPFTFDLHSSPTDWSGHPVERMCLSATDTRAQQRCSTTRHIRRSVADNASAQIPIAQCANPTASPHDPNPHAHPPNLRSSASHAPSSSHLSSSSTIARQ
ncbi:hypothetical protein EV122DRAFT_268376 [Schizophyllum commune]